MVMGLSGDLDPPDRVGKRVGMGMLMCGLVGP